MDPGHTQRVQAELSVVLPVYNEEQALPLLMPRLKSVLGSLHLPYEVIFVDDGSTDGSARYIRELCEQDCTVKLLTLSRNFGHHVALTAGLDHASGGKVVLMDADLQDEPETIPRFFEIAKGGYQVVYASRFNRQERPLKRWLSRLYHRLLRRLAALDIPVDAGIFCLMDREVVSALRHLSERHRYLNGLRAWVGFRQAGVDVVRPDRPRAAGPPKYSFAKLFGLSLEGIFSFSYVPLRLATWFGLLFCLVAVLLVGLLAYRRLFGGFVVPGWTSLLSVVLLLGGAQLVTLGILGEYIGRIYDEVKRRPLYVVASKTGFDP